MSKYKYTLINRGQPVASSDDIEPLRDGVRELGHKAFIQYNETGIIVHEQERNDENQDEV